MRNGSAKGPATCQLPGTRMFQMIPLLGKESVASHVRCYFLELFMKLSHAYYYHCAPTYACDALNNAAAGWKRAAPLCPDMRSGMV